MAKIDALQLWSLEYRLLMLVISSIASEVTALGLEVKELFVLMEVDAHPHPAALAEQLCMAKASVTVYVKNLEKAGFVKREIDPDDLRRHRLAITPAGRKTLVRGQELIVEAFGARLSRLTAAEQAQLGKLVEKMSAPA